jgi:hypothetical protein
MKITAASMRDARWSDQGLEALCSCGEEMPVGMAEGEGVDEAITVEYVYLGAWIEDVAVVSRVEKGVDEMTADG